MIFSRLFTSIIALSLAVSTAQANIIPTLFKAYNGRYILHLAIDETLDETSKTQLDALYEFVEKYRTNIEAMRIRLIFATPKQHLRDFQEQFLARHLWYDRQLFTGLTGVGLITHLLEKGITLPKTADEALRAPIMQTFFGNFNESDIHYVTALPFEMAIAKYFSPDFSHNRDLYKRDLMELDSVVISNLPGTVDFFNHARPSEPASVKNIDLLKDNPGEQSRFIAFMSAGTIKDPFTLDTTTAPTHKADLILLAQQLLRPRVTAPAAPSAGAGAPSSEASLPTGVHEATPVSPTITAPTATSDTAPKTCDTCHKPGDLICSGCRAARYCSVDCQRNAWKNHKKVCVKKASAEIPVHRNVTVHSYRLPTRYEPSPFSRPRVITVVNIAPGEDNLTVEEWTTIEQFIKKITVEKKIALWCMFNFSSRAPSLSPCEEKLFMMLLTHNEQVRKEYTKMFLQTRTQESTTFTPHKVAGLPKPLRASYTSVAFTIDSTIGLKELLSHFTNNACIEVLSKLTEERTDSITDLLYNFTTTVVPLISYHVVIFTNFPLSSAFFDHAPTRSTPLEEFIKKMMNMSLDIEVDIDNLIHTAFHSHASDLSEAALSAEEEPARSLLTFAKAFNR